MNPKLLVKISNIIGIISIILLIYWIFFFITVEVFKLKVFQENISESFYLSILGILALMFAALMINIMFNLTIIAQSDKSWFLKSKKSQKNTISILIAIFPIILGFLFAGDYWTSKKKENLLLQTAKSIGTDYPVMLDKLLNYSFSKDWMDEAEGILSILSKTSKHFPSVSVITKDSINATPLFLNFNEHLNSYFKIDDFPKRKNYIFETSKPEKKYLNKIFEIKSSEIRFSAHDGNYQLFYPYIKNDKVIVLYFSDYNRYGKLGSY